jgi:hypothetical protein
MSPNLFSYQMIYLLFLKKSGRIEDNRIAAAFNVQEHRTYRWFLPPVISYHSPTLIPQRTIAVSNIVYLRVTRSWI